MTANYKMTFDRLRMELSGLDAWIVVLNTYGINVVQRVKEHSAQRSW